jgi:cysteine desulfurase
MRRVYLDANASEPLRPAAREAVLDALDQRGNPSSIHADGRRARVLLEDARETIARCFGGRAADLIFTSGGTEADALAIHALGVGRRVLVGATEHDAVRAAAHGAEILRVDRNGHVDLDDVDRRLKGLPALVCLMLANNETGVVQDIAEVAKLCRSNGALLIVDAVQAVGRIGVDLGRLGADGLTISSHKVGGPKGAGALLFSKEAAAVVRPLIVGGGQERGWRGGTPALPAIAGFAAAVQSRPDGEKLAALRDSLERDANRMGAIVIGTHGPRLPNTSCLALPGVRAETQVIALDLSGVAVSAGAACSSGKVSRSHVLEAMGLGRLAGEAIRVSLPWNATEDDIAIFLDAYRAMASRVRRVAA